MNCVPARVTRDPSVPPQQVLVFPLIVKSDVLLPELPNLIGAPRKLSPGTRRVTVAAPDDDGLAVGMALTVTVTGALLAGMMLFEIE